MSWGKLRGNASGNASGNALGNAPDNPQRRPQGMPQAMLLGKFRGKGVLLEGHSGSVDGMPSTCLLNAETCHVLFIWRNLGLD